MHLSTLREWLKIIETDRNAFLPLSVTMRSISVGALYARVDSWTLEGGFGDAFGGWGGREWGKCDEVP